MADNLSSFEVRTDIVEVTRDGSLGGPADTHQVFVPGLRRCYINGEPVTREEFERRLQEASDNFKSGD